LYVQIAQVFSARIMLSPRWVNKGEIGQEKGNLGKDFGGQIGHKKLV